MQRNMHTVPLHNYQRQLHVPLEVETGVLSQGCLLDIFTFVPLAGCSYILIKLAWFLMDMTLSSVAWLAEFHGRPQQRKPVKSAMVKGNPK